MNRNKNFARRQPLPVEPGHVFEGCNFSQDEPGTVLEAFAGVPLTFRDCNLARVAVDPAWTVEDCNTTQAALPPELTERERYELELVHQRQRKAAAEREITRLERAIGDFPAPADPPVEPGRPE